MTRDVEPNFKEFGSPKAKHRKPIPHKSARQLAVDAVLTESHRVVKRRSRGRCEMPEPHAHGCNGWAVDHHHIIPRSMGGGHQAFNLAHLSRECHDFAEANSEEAICRLRPLRARWMADASNIPPDAGILAPKARQALAYVIESTPPITVRDVAMFVGCAVSTAYAHLKDLRTLGLVDWVDGKQGTITATVRAVEFDG